MFLITWSTAKPSYPSVCNFISPPLLSTETFQIGRLCNSLSIIFLQLTELMSSSNFIPKVEFNFYPSFDNGNIFIPHQWIGNLFISISKPDPICQYLDRGVIPHQSHYVSTHSMTTTPSAQGDVPTFHVTFNISDCFFAIQLLIQFTCPQSGRKTIHQTPVSSFLA